MHNEVSCRPIDEKCHFFPNILFNKFDILIMKIMLNCNEWPLKLCMRKFTLCSFLMNKLHEILLELYQKVSDGNFCFGWVYTYQWDYAQMLVFGICLCEWCKFAPTAVLWSTGLLIIWCFWKITYPTAATILHYWDQSYTYFFSEE